VLIGGVVEWGGPAHCTEEFAVAMGFTSVAGLFDSQDRLLAALRNAEPLTQIDWARALLLSEVVFASDVVGSGLDWSITVGLSDEETIRVLREIQRKIPKAGVVGTCFGTFPRQP
jgi:hypothetical protein